MSGAVVASSVSATGAQTTGSAVAPGGVATTGTPGDPSNGATAVSGAEAFDFTYRLAPGDLLDVKFPYHPEENERVPIRPDGKIELQIAGEIGAAGMTPRDLEKEIVRLSAVTLKNPVVSVTVAQHAEHKVYVGGDVAKPGFVLYRDGLTPLQAIVERGGPLDTADLDEVVLITRDGEQTQSVKLDVEAVLDGDSAEQITMAPDDILIVPRTWIGKADVWVDQWIRGLLPTVPRPGFDLNQVSF